MPAISKFSNFSPEVLNVIQKQTLKNFGYGFTLSGAISLLSWIQNLFRKKKKVTDYQKYLNNALRTGTFLASWSLIYQFLIRNLESNLNHPNALYLVTSGFISGFSSMYLTQGISWKLSLYIFLRSLYSWFRIKLDKFPMFVQNFSPVLFYCVLNVGLGYMSQLHSEYLDSSYGSFLSLCAGVSQKGLKSAWNKEILPDCHPDFHDEKSCILANINRAKRIFLRILKIYVPFYFISSILKGSFFKFSMEKQKQAWISLIKNVARSTTFLFLQCLICGPSLCILKLFTNKHKLFYHGILWFLGSFSIWFESPSRVKEINIFTLWKLCVTLINYKMDVKEFIQDGKSELHSDTFNFWASNFIFGIASAVSLYCLVRNRKQLKSLDRTILMLLFPEKVMK